MEKVKSPTLQSKYRPEEEQDFVSWLYKMFLAKKNNKHITYNRIIDLAKEFYDIEIDQSTVGSYFNDFRKSLAPVMTEQSLNDTTVNLLLNAHTKNVNSKNRSAINRKLKDISEQFLLKELITNSIKELEPLQYEIKDLQNGESEAVLLLSDWHKGQVSDNFFNKFNDEIFHQRVEKLLNKNTKTTNLRVLQRIFKK